MVSVFTHGIDSEIRIKVLLIPIHIKIVLHIGIHMVGYVLIIFHLIGSRIVFEKRINIPLQQLCCKQWQVFA